MSVIGRRDLLKGALVGGCLSVLGLRAPLVQAQDYRGKLFVLVQADGAWDPTSFCDPKTNTPGEPVINHWAEQDETRVAGNIPYAPFADNQAFFEKHHDKMLVINGVDFQTNSHTTGIVHAWSGRTGRGFPSLTALLAAHFAPGLAVPYLTFGGFADTGGVTRYTRMSNPDAFRNVARPDQRVVSDVSGPNPPYLHAEDWSNLRARARDRANRLASVPGLLPDEARNRRFLASSLASADGLQAFADAVPDSGFAEREQLPAGNLTFWSTLRRDAEIAILAFRTGVAVSADLWLGGFDSHADNDVRQEVLLTNLTQSVDYLWDYAEEQGLADRLVVVLGSDFGRTNFYNADEGKDHWPIGSYVIMEKHQSWTNRVVGETDGLHFAQRINPRTLERDDANGTIIYPKHVHKALRRYLGVENSPGARRFPFNNTEDFRFFA